MSEQAWEAFEEGALSWSDLSDQPEDDDPNTRPSQDAADDGGRSV